VEQTVGSCAMLENSDQEHDPVRQRQPAVETTQVAGVVSGLQGAFLFERLSLRHHDKIEWHGTAQDILRAVENAIVQNSLARSYWMSARLMRVIMHHSLNDPPAKAGLITQTTKFLLELYAGRSQAEDFSKIVQTIEAANLQHFVVEQEYDETTLEATVASRSRDAAHRLAQKTNDPLLLLPLCNGGLVAGIQTALLHQRERPGHDVMLYPVLFSRWKSGHLQPQINSHEQAFLQEASDGRKVVVFDEDASTGASVTRAMRYFSNLLSGSLGTLGMVNQDSRSPLIIQTQGEWWEKV
jgi:hypothetical protein